MDAVYIFFLKCSHEIVKESYNIPMTAKTYDYDLVTCFHNLQFNIDLKGNNRQ